MSKLFAAIDVDFVLAIEVGVEDCQGAVDILSKVGYSIVVSPVVEEDLYDISTGAKNPVSKETAQNAYLHLATFGFLTPGMTPMEVCLSRLAVERFMDQRLISGWHYNDYRSLTEASVLDARLLLTNRRKMSETERRKLDAAMLDMHLSPVKVLNSTDLSRG